MDDRSKLNLLGGILVTAAIGWLNLVNRSDVISLYVSLLFLVIAATYAISRFLTRRNPLLVSYLLVAAGAGYAIARADVLYGHPIVAPLEYSNAAAALFVLAAAAALVVYGRAVATTVKTAAIFAAITFATVPIFNTTVTASALGLLLPFGLLFKSARSRRLLILGSGAAYLLTLLGAVLLGLAYHAGTRNGLIFGLVTRGLSERRLMLWSDALQLIYDHPLTGVGIGRFDNVSPVALSDLDTKWPHNEALQFGAESGIPGMAILLLAFAWSFARLWRGESDRTTAIVVLAIAGLAVHSNVDYILHFPAVPLAAAALLGTGNVGPRPAGRKAVDPVGNFQPSSTSGETEGTLPSTEDEHVA